MKTTSDGSFPSLNKPFDGSAGLMLGTIIAGLGALASPEEIRRKATEVVSRPDYELQSPPHSESLGIFARLLKWFLDLIGTFFQSMAGLPDALRWIIVAVLLVTLVLLVTHIIITFVRAFRGNPKRRSSLKPKEQKMTWEDWIWAAEEAHARGDYIGAVRFLFSASLLLIEQAEQRPLRKGITNRELLRRYRSTPLAEPLSQFVDVIDAKWYGHEICQEEDYRNCQEEHSRIRRLSERRLHAVGS